MKVSGHFDRRGSTYDADETHRRIVALLVSGAALRAGMRVLDVATGTGAAALKAAEAVGSTGSVVGMDISAGMLAEARRKTTAGALGNVEFMQADAERVDFAAESVDAVLCASGVVLMSDIPGALRRWTGWLRPEGCIAFDVPAKPFGISQMVAEAAAAHGVTLPYNSVADTPSKCRALLEGAGCEAIGVNTEVVSDEWVEVQQAIAFLDDRRDHPAWRALQEAPPEVREAIRDAFVRKVHEGAVAGRVRSEVVQHFVYGRKVQAER